MAVLGAALKYWNGEGKRGMGRREEARVGAARSCGQVAYDRLIRREKVWEEKSEWVEEGEIEEVWGEK